MITISFSWDDGAVMDLRLMDLSLRYNVPCIFFIPASNPERAVLNKSDIRIIAEKMEIGSHTYSHTYLSGIPASKAEQEMIGGKDFLEQLLGKEIPHFCFPGGKYNAELLDVSKKFFKSARTADTGAIYHNDSYILKPAFHFYDRGKRSLMLNGLRNTSPIFRITLKNYFTAGYFNLLKNVIRDLDSLSYEVKINIWGHSWELDRFNLWGELESLFKELNELYPGRIKSYSDFLAGKN